jgi:membrane-associated phospholipid phosphatase
MKGFNIFLYGAVLVVVIGLTFSLIGEKAQFLLWTAANRNSFTDHYFYYITLAGEWYGFVALGLLLWISSWRKMVTVPLLGGIVMVTSYLVKEYFQHERPSVFLDRIGYAGPMSVLGYPMLQGHHSFPSGHSMAAWALFTLVAALEKKTWVSITCLIMAVSVSLSRIYLMAHFLEDVVAGAMIGIALGYVVYFLYGKWTKETSVGV